MEMAKIGRNYPCPCGSGKKYKHCCLDREDNSQPAAHMGPQTLSLRGAIEKLQESAAKKEPVLRELGVFVFFSDTNGDAWVLEVSDSDAVQVAEAGRPLEIELEENPETIEINWSHTFALHNKRLLVTTYADRQEIELGNAPVQQINAAIKRIYKRFTPEVLGQVHLADTSAGSTAA